MRGGRLAPLSGIVFAVLFVAAFLVIGNYEFMPPAGEVAAFYQDRPARIMTGAYLGLLSTVFLILFGGSVHSTLRRSHGASASLSVAGFGGGVVAAVLMAVGFLATIAGAERAMLQGPVDPDAAAALFDLSSLSTTGAAFGFAVLLAAVALAGSGAGFHRWLTWSGGVIAVGLLSPVNYIVLGLVLLWVPAVAIVLFRRGHDNEVAASDADRIGAEAAR